MKHPLISPEFQTAFQTFKTYQSYIENTLTTPYTNGPIEGINNKIKVIKRIAFSYRSFYHWVTYHAEHVSSTSRVIKSRILITQNLTKPKVKNPSSIATRISIQVTHCNRLKINQQHYLTKSHLSPELKATYDLYQDLLFALQTKNFERFHHLLQVKHPLISPEFQTAFQTFKTYQSYIENTLTTPYTNGPIEGINNKIKVIKRIAFGYRSFYHFKSRILMTQNLTKPKVKILAA